MWFDLFGSVCVSWRLVVGVRKRAAIGLAGGVPSSPLTFLAGARCGWVGDGLTCSVSAAGGARTGLGAGTELAMTFADE